ncbi:MULTISPECIES: hypothetical protein [unclassified Oceanobacter]|nr:MULTISPECIES: hypothetical protein [unclassified Oceanobacter]MDP2548954.1 hypothetical protein [Oceanobacter sp. 4_MG-2023]MDP2609662.1 hypothetical protein [Oceanobacter sp. 1_MG-2023]MDP2613380.1 hypothetical protein [Oceanobacter sp. 2_MG-2023]
MQTTVTTTMITIMTTTIMMITITATTVITAVPPRRLTFQSVQGHSDNQG